MTCKEIAGMVMGRGAHVCDRETGLMHGNDDNDHHNRIRTTRRFSLFLLHMSSYMSHLQERLVVNKANTSEVHLISVTC